MDNNSKLPLFKKTINDQLRQIENGNFKIKVPKLEGLKLFVPNMHYHLTPELFIQIDGVSRFTFPGEEYRLEKGQICIVPATMPHYDSCYYPHCNFFNIVGMFQKNIFSLHAATTKCQGSPELRCRDTFFFESNYQRTLESCLSDIAIYYHKSGSQKVIRGLLFTVFSILSDMLDNYSMPHRAGSDNVIRSLDIIHIYLFRHELSVKLLADQLNLSADYLSNLFVKKQNMTITEYINSQRINVACKYLRDTSLNISEISWACGYKDAAYFARVFKRLRNVTPRQYRSG